MRVNGKNNTLLLSKFVLSTMSHESEHSESEFYYPGELSHAELLLQSPTHSESKERNLTLLANEEAHTSLRNQQANRRSRKQLFRINCPIINLSNKQTVGETSFLQRHQRINRESKERKPKMSKYDIRLNVFFEFQSFWEKLVEPEKSQTFLVCSRINCSVVSTSVLFEETKLNANTSSSR